MGATTELDALMEHAALLATDWEIFLAGDLDGERPLPPDEGTNTIPAGVVIAVVLYHGSEHRGQTYHPRRARPRAARPHTLGLRIRQRAHTGVGAWPSFEYIERAVELADRVR